MYINYDRKRHNSPFCDKVMPEERELPNIEVKARQGGGRGISMQKIMKFHKMALILLLPLLLTGCAQQEIGGGQESGQEQEIGGGQEISGEQNIGQEESIPSSMIESSADVEKPENNPDAQQDVSVDNSNQDILNACAGTKVTRTIETSGGVISIDAQVDVEGISRVSRYRYIPLQFTEEKRKALLKKMFPAEDWDVNEAAVYNANEEKWEFITPLGEDCVFQVRDSQTLDEQIVNVERLKAAMDYTAEREVTPIRLPDTPEEDMMVFFEFTDFPLRPSEIEQIGKITIASVAEEEEYFCNYIHICGKDGEHPYIKAVFKQRFDGMPVTVWHDIGTATLKDNFKPVKVWGSFYSVEDIGLAEPILTPTEAVAVMQEQINSVQIQETQVYVTKISLEYLAVISSEGEPEIVPIWRFWPGSDELERIMMCEQIFAVNAFSGELIWEKRGVFTE